MNKAYRIIWSPVRNCFVAVSEAMKSRGRAGKSLLTLTAGATLALCTGLNSPAAFGASLVTNWSAASYSGGGALNNNTGAVANTATLGATTVTVNGPNLMNAGGLFASNWTSILPSSYVPTTPASPQAVAIGYNQSATTQTLTFSSAVINPILMFNYIDIGQYTFNNSVQLINFSGSSTGSLSGNTLTITSRATGDQNQGVAVEVLGSYTTLSFSISCVALPGSCATTDSAGFGIAMLANPNIVSSNNGSAGYNTTSTLGSGTYNLRFDGGTLLADQAGTYTQNFTITTANGYIDQNGNASTFSGNIANDGSLAGRLFIGNTGTAGSGYVALTGNNTYTGGTAVGAGANLHINAGAALGTGSLDLVGNSTTQAGLTVTGTTAIANPVSVAYNSAINVATGTITTMTGAITDGVSPGSLIVNNDGTSTGTLALAPATSGTNTYSGGTFIYAGTLQAGAINALPTTGTVTVASGASFDLNSYNQQIGSLTGAGNVTLGSAMLTLANANNTYSGAISGAGGLALTGGAETLSGVNTYTGGTRIAASSTLTLSGAASLGSGNYAGSIANDGSLVYNSSATQTLGGIISGVGNLTQSGSGTLTLSGINSYTGSTTINNGSTLSLSGATASIDTTSGVTNNGTFDISNAGAVVNLTGSGSSSYTQASGATLNMAGSPGGFQMLNITGSATLAGTLSLNASAGTYAPGTYTLIHANGSVSGAFTSFANNLASVTPLGFSLGYGANDVYLYLTSTQAGYVNSVTAIQSTPALNAAAVLDGLSQSNPVIQSLANVPQAQVGNAVTQTLPLLSGGSLTTAGGALAAVNKVVQARIESNRGLSAGDAFYGDQHFWMKPFGSWAGQSDQNGVSGYKTNVAGMIFGTDGTISDKSRIGLSFAYANARINGNSTLAPNSANTDVYTLIGYGSYRIDSGAEVSYQLDLGNNRNYGYRNMTLVGLTAASNYTTQTAHAGIGIGKSWVLSDANTFTPSARVDYTRMRDAAYVETGAGALNLNVNARTTDELVFSGDGKFSHKLNDSSTLATNVGLGYDAAAKAASVVAAFAGAQGAAFTTTSMTPSPWIVRGGLGYIHSVKNGPEVTARYDIEHRTGFNNQTVSAKLRWMF